jgi:hypothetical protein
MANTLFGAKLDSLHPANMLRTEARPQLMVRQLAEAEAAAPPTNAEILDAAKSLYAAHSDAVDMSATSGVQYARSSEGQPKVAALNNYNWKSQQAGPITPVTQQILEAPLMRGPVDAATSHSDIWSFVIGASESAQLIIGEEGGVGIAFALRTPTEIKGLAYVAGKLGLDIDLALNLQVGLWNDPPSKLAGQFYGLEVNGEIGPVACSLGIFVTPQMRFAGFSLGIGVGVGGGVTVVGGYTWVF